VLLGRGADLEEVLDVSGIYRRVIFFSQEPLLRSVLMRAFVLSTGWFVFLLLNALISLVVKGV